MRCAICGKTNHILTSSLCLRCYVSKQATSYDPEPLYPGDVVEVVKEDNYRGMRGFVVPSPSVLPTADIWVRLKANREDEPAYVPFARDDVKLFSRLHGAQQNVY